MSAATFVVAGASTACASNRHPVKGNAKARSAALGARRAVASRGDVRALSSERHASFRASTARVGARRASPVTPRALDAAQPFDFEAKQRQKVEKKRTLKIGIVGFGNFGQFLAKRFIKNGHDVIATSRSDYGSIAA